MGEADSQSILKGLGIEVGWVTVGRTGVCRGVQTGTLAVTGCVGCTWGTSSSVLAAQGPQQAHHKPGSSTEAEGCPGLIPAPALPRGHSHLSSWVYNAGLPFPSAATWLLGWCFLEEVRDSLH